MDIQPIARLPLKWGEGIAHAMYREPSTGMLVVREMSSAPDALTPAR